MKPKLRFKEFTDDWEEKKLGDIVIFENNKRKPITESDRQKGKYPYYGATGIVDYVDDYLFDGVRLLVGEDGADWSAYANTAFIATGKYWVNNHAHVIATEDMNLYFLKYLLNFMELRKWVCGNAPAKLNLESIKNISIQFPSLPEQEKIGTFLSLVDQRIEKAEKKISLLKEEKKGWMQKLFQQEIRFKDEQGNNYPDWEEKKIKDTVTFENNKRKPITESDRSKGKYPYYGATGIVDYVDDYLFDDVRLLVGEDGADWSAYANTAFIATGKYWVNNHAHVITTKVMNLYFLKYLFNFMELRKWVCGNAPAKLNLESIKSIYIQIPSLPEQEKIANFLSLLDQRIEKEERKVEILKEEKKGLLQNMFV